MTYELQLGDIQGLVIRGYGNLTAACYVLIEIVDAAAAKGWLDTLAGDLTSAEVKPRAEAVNLAFTHSGLQKLGLPGTTLDMFSLQYIDGMLSPQRSRILGDTDESAPEYWDWGGPGTTTIDAALLLYATDDHVLAQVYAAHSLRLNQAGLREIVKLDTTNLGFKEHFGFRDGISQPTIAGSGHLDTDANTIQPGEFLLGYPNEHGQAALSPTVPLADDPQRRLPSVEGDADHSDFGLNGSYLVFRQLEQNVHGFWRSVDDATRNADGTSNEETRTRLASKMVGRWPSGAPLVKTPEHDNAAMGGDNDFMYAFADPYGFNCPVGAHIRRANPRDSLEPGPGTAQSIAVSKHHRLIRRGREYGEPVDPATLFTETPSTSANRGLQFVAICGDIARQFEFIQHTWVMSTKFDGLYDDADPIMGAPQPGRGTFTEQAEPVRHRFAGLSRFVTVRGGAYFFLPGLRATRYLAALP